MFRIRLLVFGLSALVGMTAFSMTPFAQVYSISNPIRMVNSQAGGFDYAYAPTIIYAEGQFHSYFCSTGNKTANSWDYIRHETSTDLIHWSSPNIVLEPAAVERANCDPSVVLYDAGDGPYYYMFYSGNVANVQTVNFVARSQSPGGPFLKYTDNGTWANNPSNPHVITWPYKATPDKGGSYGAGEPTVVSANGKLYMWYSDSTTPGYYNAPRLMMTTSTDAVHWTPAVGTAFTEGSVDVKYDPRSGKFVMFNIVNNQNQNSELALSFSDDGLSWSQVQVICDQNCFPHWAHNVGASSDAQGHLIADSAGNTTVLVAYGAPIGLNPGYNNSCSISKAPYCWAYWDIYANLITLNMPRAAAPTGLYPMSSAAANDILWSPNAVLDGDPTTVYSSQVFPSVKNTRGSDLAVWTQGVAANVNEVLLTANMVNGTPAGFPDTYSIFLTNSSNTAYIFVGNYSIQPDTQGIATVVLPTSYVTYGVVIAPVTLGRDHYGNNIFQLADVRLGTTNGGAQPGYVNLIPFARADSNNQLWPASNAIDNNVNTSFSSNVFSSIFNTNGANWVAWTSGSKAVSGLVLTPRTINGMAAGFPSLYDVYVTSPDNSRWILLGHFETQPGLNGRASIQLGGSYNTSGVLVVTSVAGKDDVGNAIFQLSEVDFAN